MQWDQLPYFLPFTQAQRQRLRLFRLTAWLLTIPAAGVLTAASVAGGVIPALQGAFGLSSILTTLVFLVVTVMWAVIYGDAALLWLRGKFQNRDHQRVVMLLKAWGDAITTLQTQASFKQLSAAEQQQREVCVYTQFKNVYLRYVHYRAALNTKKYPVDKAITSFNATAALLAAYLQQSNHSELAVLLAIPLPTEAPEALPLEQAQLDFKAALLPVDRDAGISQARDILEPLVTRWAEKLRRQTNPRALVTAAHWFGNAISWLGAAVAEAAGMAFGGLAIVILLNAGVPLAAHTALALFLLFFVISTIATVILNRKTMAKEYIHAAKYITSHYRPKRNRSYYWQVARNIGMALLATLGLAGFYFVAGVTLLPQLGQLIHAPSLGHLHGLNQFFAWSGLILTLFCTSAFFIHYAVGRIKTNTSAGPKANWWKRLRAGIKQPRVVAKNTIAACATFGSLTMFLYDTGWDPGSVWLYVFHSHTLALVMMAIIAVPSAFMIFYLFQDATEGLLAMFSPRSKQLMTMESTVVKALSVDELKRLAATVKVVNPDADSLQTEPSCEPACIP